jgi:hypothetical protein
MDSSNDEEQGGVEVEEGEPDPEEDEAAINPPDEVRKVLYKTL